MWIGASGPASPVVRGYWHRIGSLGPGLTSESADAVSGCPAKRSVGRAQFLAPTGGVGLICRAWTRGGVFTGPTASGCVPSLQPEKRSGWPLRAAPGDENGGAHVARRRRHLLASRDRRKD